MLLWQAGLALAGQTGNSFLLTFTGFLLHSLAIRESFDEISDELYRLVLPAYFSAILLTYKVGDTLCLE